MIKTDAVGPTLQELRPERPSTPLIEDFAAKLLAPQDGPDDEIAYAMAALSTYAYSDVWTVAGMASRLGLPGNYTRQLAVEIDVLFVRSTAYLIQSADGKVVILVYRGTSPMSAINWLGDLDIDPEQIKLEVPGAGPYHPVDVHRGFYRNVRATGWQVVRGLKRAAQGESVARRETDGEIATDLSKMEALYIAGHSLGGAMAALSSILLQTIDAPEIIDCLRGVYTYGAPMVGDPALAKLCDESAVLKGKVARYVYDDDAVPQLPPKASGVFEHFGTELRYRPKAGWTESKEPVQQLASLLRLGELVPSFLARQVSVLRGLPFGVSLSDHLPQHYIDALLPEGVVTEFGE